MLHPRTAVGDPDVRITRPIALRLFGIGLLVGAISGFFGIGGFLVVPGIMLGSGVSILNAVGSSLLSVAAFGLTTAINYALSGLIDLGVALLFVTGGVVGGLFGMRLAVRLAKQRRAPIHVFAAVIFVVAADILAWTAAPAWL